MKFILINAAIVAALAYWVVAGGSEPGGSRGAVADAVLKVTALADRAVERVTALPAKPAAVEPAPVALPKPEAPKLETTKAEAPTVEPPKAETPKTEAPPAGLPAAAPPPAVAPPVEVAPRPTNTVANQAAAVARLTPEVEKRRNEVLSEAPPKPSGRAPAKARVAVKDGEILMTPKERRRELDALVESMELVYLRHHGR